MSGSRDCICIIKSRTGDLALKKFFQYGSQGDSEIIGTLRVKDNFDYIYCDCEVVTRWRDDFTDLNQAYE